MPRSSAVGYAYPVRVARHRSGSDGYTLICADLPILVATGTTPAEALVQAVRILDDFLTLLLRAHINPPWPSPRSPGDVLLHPSPETDALLIEYFGAPTARPHSKGLASGGGSRSSTLSD